MADDPEQLLANNRAWARRLESEDPGFFRRLTAQQSPQYLWIGCSDSRVPANQIIGLPPGEIFVHRNVANVILHTDMNCLSVVEFAVKVIKVRHIIVCGHYGCGGVEAAMKVIKVRHIIVCGHYGCGGVEAAMKGQKTGLVDHWLRGIRDLYEMHQRELDELKESAALARLCELNVLRQLRSLCQTSILREVWDEGQHLTVHGWIYSIEDGLLHDLGADVDAESDLSMLDRS